MTIPAELARELDITPGTKLDWTIGAEGVLVVKIIPNRPELARRLAGRGRRHLRDVGESLQVFVSILVYSWAFFAFFFDEPGWQHGGVCPAFCAKTR
jgi:hypothetical protein